MKKGRIHAKMRICCIFAAYSQRICYVFEAVTHGHMEYERCSVFALYLCVFVTVFVGAMKYTTNTRKIQSLV